MLHVQFPRPWIRKRTRQNSKSCSDRDGISVSSSFQSMTDYHILKKSRSPCSATLFHAFCLPIATGPSLGVLGFYGDVKVARCRIRRFSSVQGCSQMLERTSSINQAKEIEATLRSLGATSAAKHALSVLSAQGSRVPETWPALLSVLNKHGINNFPLSRITSKLGIVSLLSITPTSASKTLDLFEKSLSISCHQQRQILSVRPDILLMDLNMIRETLNALHQLGMQPKHIRRILLRWPHILSLHPTAIYRLAKFLGRPPLSFPYYKVCFFIRRFPWIISIDIDSQMAPTIDWLSEYITHISPKSDLKQLLGVAPGLLVTKRANLHSVMHFLECEACLEQHERVSIMKKYPQILTCSTEKQLRPALHFLRNTLSLEHFEVIKIVRSFPYILTLDVQQEMIPVVEFFKFWGVTDVSLFVKQFPSILGYDLRQNTLPKVEYFMQEVGLSVDELSQFPACFSYDLGSRIIPRTQFVKEMGCSVRDIGLNRVLSPSDEEFCRLIHIELSQYKSFLETRVQNIEGKDLV